MNRFVYVLKLALIAFLVSNTLRYIVSQSVISEHKIIFILVQTLLTLALWLFLVGKPPEKS
ncbi:MAG: hypothetical protein Q4F01_09275 [Staphylococcus rostri]|uniref:hypothetical protein n=1 Tax=Staphylococcus rostri TaxID=522262 RepID=UPI0026DFD7B0|nr:hypothetical protein [Staphylococcus rostri]MDO5376356.1 hypothetical protein [Staphylococcus rostri]